MLFCFHENQIMDSFLHWYSEHNKLIIQTLTVIIGLGFIYFFYRLFYLEKKEQDANGVQNESKIDSIDRKVTTILDTVASGKASVAENTTVKPAVEKPTEPSSQNNVVVSSPSEAIASSASGESLEKLNKENSQLQENLNQKNAEIEKLKAEIDVLKVKSQNAGQQTTTFVDNASGAPDPVMKAELEDLKKKLSEYEIIADDIAELQNLRQELAALKAQAETKTDG